MAKEHHTHAKNCPDYKAAKADRAAHDADALKREVRRQAIAHSHWMDDYDKVK